MFIYAEHMDNLHFIYYDNPRLLPWLERLRAKFRYFYYYAWQWGAYKLALEYHEVQVFDFVHHVTWVQVRMPSFMGRLGIPFILGPIGGGEKAPWRLRSALGCRQWFVDFLRDIWSLISKIDPFLRQTYRDATKIIVTSEDTMAFLPKYVRHKEIIHLAIAHDPKNKSISFERWRKSLLFKHFIYRVLSRMERHVNRIGGIFEITEK